MKKFWSIILIVAILGMAACSSKDNKTEMPDEIVGTWQLHNMAIGKLETSDADVEEFAREDPELAQPLCFATTEQEH